MSSKNQTQRPVLSRYSPRSAFTYIPTGPRDAGLPTWAGEPAPIPWDRGAWTPALLPQTSSASLVRQHLGLDHPWTSLKGWLASSEASTDTLALPLASPSCGNQGPVGVLCRCRNCTSLFSKQRWNKRLQLWKQSIAQLRGTCP